MGRSHVQNAYATASTGAEVLRLADFPKRTAMPSRDGAPRGEILLFTGIRYERLTEPTESPPIAHTPPDQHCDDGRVRGSRRRKRRG